jgi:hypothetical protein
VGISGFCFPEGEGIMRERFKKLINYLIIMDNTQQPKPDPKGKATVSFMLGIISIIPLAISWVLDTLITPFMDNPNTISSLSFSLGISFLPIASLLALIGAVLGIIGLKSSKRKYAIVGLILGIYVLLFFVLKTSGFTF